MITEIKNICEKVILSYTSITKIVRRKIEEKDCLAIRKYPFAVLLTADGKFDDKVGGEIRYNDYDMKSVRKDWFDNFIEKITIPADESFIISKYCLNDEDTYYLLKGDASEEDQKIIKLIFDSIQFPKYLYSVIPRTARKIPIEIKVYAEKEELSDQYLSDIIRNMPRNFNFGQIQGNIEFLTEAHDDYVSNFKDLATSIVVVNFSIKVGTDPVVIPTIRTSDFQGGSINE